MTAPGTETGTNSALRPGAALAALAGAQFTVVLSTSIVNVALPAVRDGVGLSDSGMSWVVNAYGLAFGALLLPGGRVADLLGGVLTERLGWPWVFHALAPAPR
ncbi:hypothetical protein [Streptomyces sp. CB01881]|uniref:hypothetical protein n=1 Tax=Streptomyces sp. CB01881 TaxID=2078691 RepID=UPI001F11F366|nr:hypothetical protein [Streptomyces sp. CB01881]